MRRSLEITFYIFTALLGFSVISEGGNKPVTFGNVVGMIFFIGLTFGNIFMAVDTIRETIKEGMTALEEEEGR